MRQKWMLLIALIAFAVLGMDIGVAHATRPASVPEPGTLTVLATGAASLGGIALLRRRKKQTALALPA